MDEKRTMWILFGSVAFLIFSIIMAFSGFPNLVNRQLNKELAIRNDTSKFELWRKLPLPINFKIYLWNVTNPEEISVGEKPKLKQVGPYVYDEYREKTILGFKENNTVEYTEKKTLIFNKEKSGTHTEDDQVTVINLIFMVVMLKLNDLMPSMISTVYKAMPLLFNELKDPFMRARVGDILFDGVFLNCDGNETTLKLVCGQMKDERAPTLRQPDDGRNGFLFSMFNFVNSTPIGPLRVDQGINNITEVGRIITYKGEPDIDIWGEPSCSMINGTDGTIFGPIDRSNIVEKLYLFQGDICRSIYVSYAGETKSFNMATLRYENTRELFASKSAVPSNKCFCKKGWSSNHDGCLMNGVMDLESCQKAPVLASLPHFYFASEELREYFEDGMEPNKEKHGSFLELEPVTGVVFRAAQRVQFNIELRKMDNVPVLESVPTGIFPLLWLEESFEANDKIVAMLDDAHRSIRYVEIARWVLLATGLIASLVSSIIYVRRHYALCGGTSTVTFIVDQHQPNGNKNLAFVEDSRSI